MIKVYRGPFWSRCEFDTDEECLWLQELCTVRSNFNYVLGAYTSVEHMLEYRDGEYWLMGGIASLVQKRAKEEGQEVLIIDERDIEPGLPQAPAVVGFPETREWQPRAYEAVRAARGGVIKAGTGAGKTAAGTMVILGHPELYWLLLVPSPNLVKGWLTILRAQGLEAIELKNMEGKSATVVVSTFATAYSQLSKVASHLACFTGLMIDEVHVTPAPTHMAVVKQVVNAAVRVGLSGTPFERSDDRDVLTVGLVGPKVFDVPNEDLVVEKAIAKAEIVMVPFDHAHSGVGDAYLRTKWSVRYRQQIVANKERNLLIARLVAIAEKPCLVFLLEINHVHTVHELLEHEGHNTAWVSGVKSTTQRANLIADTRRGHIDVIVSSKVFDTGIDIPELASIIVGGAGKAEIATIQRIGRGMRIMEGKNTFQVFDIYDRVYQALEKQSQARVRTYRAEGHDVLIKESE